MTRLEQVKQQIKPCNAYKFKETAKEVIQFYSDNEERLNQISKEFFNSYSFMNEVLRKCESKQKMSKISNIYNRVFRLSVHRYAPQMNCLHFINYNDEIVVFKTPSKTNIDDAVYYLINKSSIGEISRLTKDCKIIK